MVTGKLCAKVMRKKFPKISCVLFIGLINESTKGNILTSKEQ